MWQSDGEDFSLSSLLPSGHVSEILVHFYPFKLNIVIFSYMLHHRPAFVALFIIYIKHMFKIPAGTLMPSG